MKRLIFSFAVVVSIVVFSTVVFAAPEVGGVKDLSNRKVLLVSDIDDTIKVSHILSPAKYLRFADGSTPFTGMAQLYQLIRNKNPQTTEIAYLSNAPEEIAGFDIMKQSHENFLARNKFPQGNLLLRQSLKDQNHKINTIRKLVSEVQPEVLIMVGDNGERDAEIYAQAQKELSAQNIEIHIYIHQLYSSQGWYQTGKALQTGELGFVTPFEIALDLKQYNLISQDSLQWMFKNVMPYILNEGLLKVDLGSPVTFPFFKDCSDFRWTFIVPVEMLPLSKKINQKCF